VGFDHGNYGGGGGFLNYASIALSINLFVPYLASMALL
jgi:hypothetical protein